MTELADGILVPLVAFGIWIALLWLIGVFDG